jgi:hypothetical protein
MGNKKDKKSKKSKKGKKKFNKKQHTCFLNVDLDIESKYDISPIIRDFGDKVFILNDEPYSEGSYNLSVELNDSWCQQDPEGLILGYIELIKNFSDDAKDAWNRAHKKSFDLGYECGFQPYSINNELSNSTINAVASVGASVIFTLYSVQKEKSK